jgi:hypothetical protein
LRLLARIGRRRSRHIQRFELVCQILPPSHAALSHGLLDVGAWISYLQGQKQTLTHT